MRAPCILALAVATAACGMRTLDAPASASARAAVLLLESPSLAAYASNVAPGEQGLSVPIENDQTVWMLLYDRPLEELGLTRGMLPQASASETGRALPRPFESYRAEISGHEAGAWASADPADSAPFAAFRLPREAPVACVDRGGCYDGSSDEECKLPCEPPSPPEAPHFEVTPDLPRFTPCPAGWEEMTEARFTIADRSVVYCNPLIANTSTCPEGQVVTPGARACTVLGSPCPLGDGFPDLSASDVRYVRAGAVGGDGSRAAPYGRIADALAPFAPFALIALAPGRYDEPLELTATATIVGACATGVHLEGGVHVAAGLASIRDVTIVAPLAVDDTLVLADAAVYGGEDAITLSPDAQATILRARIDASARGVVLAERSRVEISASLVGAPLVVDATVDAHASLSDSNLRGKLSTKSATLALSRIVIDTLGDAAIVAAESAVRTEDVVIYSDGEASAKSWVTLHGGRLDMTRTSMRYGGPNGAVRLEHAATASISDSIAAVSTSSPAIAIFGGRLGLLRTLVSNERPGDGISVGDHEDTGAAGALSYDQLIILNTLTPIHASHGGVVRGRGALLDGFPFEAVKVVGRVVPDETIVELEDTRISHGQSGVVVRGPSRIIIRRLVADGLDGGGAITAQNAIVDGISDNTPVLDASDVVVRLEDYGNCVRDLRCTAAIAVESSDARVERFTIDADSAIGVSINTRGHAVFSDGSINNARAGFAVIHPGTKLEPLFIRMHFGPTTRACEPCGE